MSASRRGLAAETVEIVQRGGYASPSGAWVEIRDDVVRAVSGTRLYLPSDRLPAPDSSVTPAIEVTTESTLEAGRRVGAGAAALVFASARNPGGGFLSGAQAQEEDIACASALYECLRSVPEFYEFHRAQVDLRYSDRVIYSPEVPVFRAGPPLLDRPHLLSMLTCAAPNRGAIASNQPHLLDSVGAALDVRAERVLRVAAAHGHRTLVLGAWGCGVFANSPAQVASTFKAALRRVPAFDRIVFAILDRTGRGPTYRAFADAFAS
jgi:uncharacterized protein (TIGR02452 family)